VVEIALQSSAFGGKAIGFSGTMGRQDGGAAVGESLLGCAEGLDVGVLHPQE